MFVGKVYIGKLPVKRENPCGNCSWNAFTRWQRKRNLEWSKCNYAESFTCNGTKKIFPKLDTLMKAPYTIPQVYCGTE